MAFDVKSLTVPTELTEVPEGLHSRSGAGRTYEPSPFDKFFEAGVTPGGKGYPLPVPGNAKEQAEARKAIATELNRAALHHNKQDGATQLGYRIDPAKNMVYIRIVPKTARTRKAKEVNVGTVTTIKTGDAGDGKPEIRKDSADSKPASKTA